MKKLPVVLECPWKKVLKVGVWSLALLLFGAQAQAIDWPANPPSGEVEDGVIGRWAIELRDILVPNTLDGSATGFVMDPTGTVMTTSSGGLITGTVSADLTLDIQGKVGATHYCDEDGGDCFTAASIAALGGASLAVDVPVYADASARDTAITSPAEGDLIYIQDDGSSNETLQVYDGSAWVNVGSGSGGGGSGSGTGTYVGKTSAKHTGNFVGPGGEEGYEAGNALCNADHAGSHMCSEEEIIQTIQSEDISAISDWNISGFNAWVSAGGQKFSPADVPVNDCNGWNHGTADSYLANFWFFEVDTGGGRGGVGHCANTKYIACCQ